MVALYGRFKFGVVTAINCRCYAKCGISLALIEVVYVYWQTAEKHVL